MKINLLFPENTTGKPDYCVASDDLKADLELRIILEQMANGDRIIYDACEDALLRPLQNAECIAYRQAALEDAFKNADAVRSLYGIAAATEQIPRYHPSASDMTNSFEKAVDRLRVFTKLLTDLRRVADTRLRAFSSEGFQSFLRMLQRELSDAFFAEVEGQLEEISDVSGILISARLGGNLMFTGYRLRRRDKSKSAWLHWHTAQAYTVDPEKNPAGVSDLYKRRERAIIEATNVLAHSARFLEAFFLQRREELAFYVGCLNLRDKLKTMGLSVCIPKVLPTAGNDRSWRELYDVSLALTKGAAVVGNDLDAAGKRLYIVTGANQGGKSTFLRSLGQAQLMAQCGMMVGADSFSAPIRRRIVTHFKKEEDSAMRSGKLDEELLRMRRLADCLERGSLVLFNESFSSTNEREGSEICRQITKALMENGMEIFSVTHLYTFATAFLGEDAPLFLRAQRREDRARTFKIVPGGPLETAFGEDLYQKIFAGA